MQIMHMILSILTTFNFLINIFPLLGNPKNPLKINLILLVASKLALEQNAVAKAAWIRFRNKTCELIKKAEELYYKKY